MRPSNFERAGESYDSRFLVARVGAANRKPNHLSRFGGHRMIASPILQKDERNADAFDSLCFSFFASMLHVSRCGAFP